MVRRELEESSSSQNDNFLILSCKGGTASGWYNVSLGDGSSFFVSADYFIEHRFKKGRELTPQERDALREHSEYVEAYIKALRLLSRQKYTVKKMELKLYEKGFSETAVSKCLQGLIDKKLLNDYDYACSWLEGRIRKQSDSYNELLSKLFNKGIDSFNAKKALSVYYTERDEEASLNNLINKYLKQNKPVDKIRHSLLRKGYRMNNINHALRKNGECDECD